MNIQLPSNLRAVLLAVTVLFSGCAAFDHSANEIDFSGSYVEHLDHAKHGFAGEILTIEEGTYSHRRIPTEPCAEEGPYYECGERFEYNTEAFKQCVNQLIHQQDFLLECAEVEPPFGEYEGVCNIEGNRITFIESFLPDPTRYLVEHEGKRYLLTHVQYLKYQINGALPKRVLREI